MPAARRPTRLRGSERGLGVTWCSPPERVNRTARPRTPASMRLPDDHGVGGVCPGRSGPQHAFVVAANRLGLGPQIHAPGQAQPFSVLLLDAGDEGEAGVRYPGAYGAPTDVLCGGAILTRLVERRARRA